MKPIDFCSTFNFWSLDTHDIPWGVGIILCTHKGTIRLPFPFSEMIYCFFIFTGFEINQKYRKGFSKFRAMSMRQQRHWCWHWSNMAIQDMFANVISHCCKQLGTYAQSNKYYCWIQNNIKSIFSSKYQKYVAGTYCFMIQLDILNIG